MASRTLFHILSNSAYKPSHHLQRLLNNSTPEEIKHLLDSMTSEDVKSLQDEALIYQFLKMIYKHHQGIRFVHTHLFKERLRVLAGEKERWLRWSKGLTYLFAFGQLTLVLWSLLFMMMLSSRTPEPSLDREIHLLTLVALLLTYNGLVTLNLLRRRLASRLYPFYFKESSGRRLVIWGALATLLLSFVSLLLFFLAEFWGLFPLFLGLVVLVGVRFSMAKPVNRSFLSDGGTPYWSILLIASIGIMALIRSVLAVMSGNFITLITPSLTLLCLWKYIVGHTFLTSFTWINHLFEKNSRLKIVNIILFFLRQWLIYGSLVSFASFFNPALPYLMYPISLTGIIWIIISSGFLRILTKRRRPKIKKQMEKAEDYKETVSYLQQILTSLRHETKFSQIPTAVDKFYLLSRFYNIMSSSGLLGVLSDKVLLQKMAELENVLEQERCTYALDRLRWAKSSYKGDWYAVEQMTPNQISQVIKEIQSAYHKEEFYDRMNIYSAQINDMVPMLMWKSYHLYMNHKDSFANVY